MKRFARLLLVTVGFGALGFAMSLLPQKSATGAVGAPVNIISPLPLPVGVNNFPATLTSASVPVSGSVGVGNLLDGVGSPIPLVGRDADNGARHPFVDGCHAATPTGDPASHCSFDAPVPDGQRWVIESFTSSCAVPTGSKLLFVELLLLTNGA